MWKACPTEAFYYLIGMRIKAEGSAIHYSLWADGPADEGRIWREFLSKLREIENPVLIHYSSFESAFLMRMCEKYGGPPDGSATAKAIKSPVNILSVIFGQIYFPTYSNGLKEIAGWLGFRWSDRDPSGVQSIVWRDEQVEETTADYDRQVYPNLAGQMVLTSINQLWVADITYIRLETEFVYLAVVIDAFSRRVIGWALDRTVEDELTLTAFRMALELRRPPAGWVYHSDRGSQYASGDYTDLLQAHGCEISMSHKASPWENAGCESWMKSLKYEEVYRQEYRDLVEARASIARFIDKVYNQKRLHSALGYRPPVEFEQALLVSSGAAARA
ncbi:MAG: IS3 family transposase [Acidobacteria bacterium]|nr:MAG: IS3 family transposase [Acidobacteriota bacterium]